MPKNTLKVRPASAAERALAYAATIDADEDRRLKAAALTDSDNPPLTKTQLATARRGPGRPKADITKVLCTVRLDRDLVEALKDGGAGWQTRMNSMLRRQLRLPATKAPQQRSRQA